MKLVMLIVIALSLAATGCITYNETSDPADPEVVYVMQTPETVYMTPAPEPTSVRECECSYWVSDMLPRTGAINNLELTYVFPGNMGRVSDEHVTCVVGGCCGVYKFRGLPLHHDSANFNIFEFKRSACASDCVENWLDRMPQYPPTQTVARFGKENVNGFDVVEVRHNFPSDRRIMYSYAWSDGVYAFFMTTTIMEKERCLDMIKATMLDETSMSLLPSLEVDYPVEAVFDIENRDSHGDMCHFVIQLKEDGRVFMNSDCEGQTVTGKWVLEFKGTETWAYSITAYGDTLSMHLKNGGKAELYLPDATEYGYWR